MAAFQSAHHRGWSDRQKTWGDGGLSTMSVRQLSVFVENKAGRIADVVGTLADAGVNIGAFAVADSDFGILRLIVDQADRAQQVLAAEQFSVVEHPVVAIRLEHAPGSLASVTRLVSDSGLNIEYMYLGAGYSLLLKADDIAPLERLLGGHGFRILSTEEIC
jgi:hypothetical protein